jgi:hypothetical protein
MQFPAMPCYPSRAFDLKVAAIEHFISVGQISPRLLFDCDIFFLKRVRFVITLAESNIRKTVSTALPKSYPFSDTGAEAAPVWAATGDKFQFENKF